MIRIAVANQKGGVGKTTTTVNLGYALSLVRKNVLIVDFDPQGNATKHLGVNPDDCVNTVYEAITKGQPMSDCIRQVRANLFLCPGNDRLAAADFFLSQQEGMEFYLRRKLDEVQSQFDYCVIDCPPSLGTLAVNGIVAGDHVLVCLQAEYLALDALARLFKTLEVVKSRVAPWLGLLGILISRYDGRKRLSREVEQTVRARLGSKVFRTVIRDTVAIAEAPSYGKSILEYGPDSYGTSDYVSVTKEVLNYFEERNIRERQEHAQAAAG